MQAMAQERWTAERAWAWYYAQPWPCGFNYVPSTAINTTEMWQVDTFDRATIDRELGWAEEIGFNSCRIFLQYLVWEADPSGLLNRVDQFLSVAERHGLRTMICLFDDCAFSGKQPYLGPQDQPRAGIHNSGWVPSPGYARVVDRAAWPQLEAYVIHTVDRFRDDPRVLVWDLYNEPGNAEMGNKSLALVEATVSWARRVEPQQPLTIGIWHADLRELTEVSLASSDVLSFHNYSDLASVERDVQILEQLGRPILCTEWLRRHHGSTFQTHLPFFKHANVGCYFWSLVNGRTQTHLPWGSPEGAADPQVWFHDLLHGDGSFHVPEEQAMLRSHLRTQSRS